MKILSIFILDSKGMESLSSHPPEWSYPLLKPLIKDASLRPKHCVIQNEHCYIKKFSEKTLMFFCNDTIKSQGQINLFFTKINQVKNIYELDILRNTFFFNNLKQQPFFFLDKITLSHQKLPPKNREMNVRIK